MVEVGDGHHPPPLSQKAKGYGGVYQFTEGGRDFKPRWSPDGARIAFIRALEKCRLQIHIIASAGGEARRISAFPEGTIGTFRWSPDSKQLAVSFRPQDLQWTDRAQKEREQQGLSEPPLVIDDLYYRLDGEGYFGKQRFALYLIDAEADSASLEDGPQPLNGNSRGLPRLIYGEDTLGQFGFDFSPDGRRLVVSTNRTQEPTLEPWKDELLRIDVATGRIAPIPRLPEGPKTAVRWSPDGKTIAYAGRVGRQPVYSSENLELFVCDPVRGRARSLTAAVDLCLQAEGLTDAGVGCGEPKLQFSPDSARVYMRLSCRGESHVASVAVEGGELIFHTSGPRDVRMGNLAADGRTMALTVGDATTLAEVAVARDLLSHAGRGPAAIRMLTNLNGPLLAELQLSKPQPRWVRAADGSRVQVWIMRPPQLARTNGKAKIPAVLEIHGGPHAQYCATFFHEFQVLAAAGYAVFYSNPRGSKGYGRDHCAAIHGQWGTADWTDMQAVIAFIKGQPFVDGRCLGVMGGSYGGYMSNWIIGHSRDFAAAITDRGLCNLVSFSGTTDCIEAPSDYFPGNFWDQPEARWEQSPLRHLAKAKTPTLIIHSEGDLRCRIEQAEQLFTVLKLLGVPVRFVRYPLSTSHGMSRSGPPDLRIDRLHRILDWLRRYLRTTGK